MSDLICGRIAAGEKYNLTCDNKDDISIYPNEYWGEKDILDLFE